MKTKKFAFVMVLFFVTISAFGQSRLSPKKIMKENYQPVVASFGKDDKKPDVDQFPSYPGGIQGLYKDILNKLTYPRNAMKEGVSGKVIVSFVVKKDGTVGQVRVVKSIEKTLDKEAVWLVKHLKPWVPGYKNGEPVNVLYKLPISFKINRKYPQQY